MHPFTRRTVKTIVKTIIKTIIKKNTPPEKNKIKICVVRIKVLSLHCSIKPHKEMKRIVELTEKEYDLIETVRNYKRSYPRGEPNLRWSLRVMLEELIEEPLEK